MTPDHYAVPEGLNLRLIGYVRWSWGAPGRGNNITTLWRDHTGRFLYCEDVWTPFSVPFWMGTAVGQLTPCTPEQFATYANGICLSIDDPEESLSAYFRFQELMNVWGCLEGTEAGLNKAADQNKKR